MTNLADFDMTTLKTELRGIVALISVDRRARKPLHQQIYDSFRHRIIRRELRAGELVPSSRWLARELRVSRLPVLNAYAQLLAEGYFETRVGAGTFVATSLPAQHNARSSGAAVWVEEPGYWLVHHVLRAAGCRSVPVPIDAEGLNVAAGIRLSRKARAAFVAPSHQYPLGVTMSATRRLQLLEWAQRAAAWIVEDDYDSEYRYNSKPIASLQGMDQHDRVIYIGSFSKVMFPALRLGYIVIPPDLVERFAAMRQSMDLCPSHIPQAVMLEFIRAGHFARHIRRMRPIYAERREVLVTELARAFGEGAAIIGDEAGMHLALLLPKLRNDQQLAARAAKESLWLSPLSVSYVGKSPHQGFVLGFGNTRANQISAAVRQLKGLCAASS